MSSRSTSTVTGWDFNGTGRVPTCTVAPLLVGGDALSALRVAADARGAQGEHANRRPSCGERTREHVRRRLGSGRESEAMTLLAWPRATRSTTARSIVDSARKGSAEGFSIARKRRRPLLNVLRTIDQRPRRSLIPDGEVLAVCGEVAGSFGMAREIEQLRPAALGPVQKWPGPFYSRTPPRAVPPALARDSARELRAPRGRPSGGARPTSSRGTSSPAPSVDLGARFVGIASPIVMFSAPSRVAYTPNMSLQSSRSHIRSRGCWGPFPFAGRVEELRRLAGGKAPCTRGRCLEINWLWPSFGTPMRSGLPCTGEVRNGGSALGPIAVAEAAIVPGNARTALSTMVSCQSCADLSTAYTAVEQVEPGHAAPFPMYRTLLRLAPARPAMAMPTSSASDNSPLPWGRWAPRALPRRPILRARARRRRNRSRMCRR